jgi:hypothetical protein
VLALIWFAPFEPGLPAAGSRDRHADFQQPAQRWPLTGLRADQRDFVLLPARPRASARARPAPGRCRRAGARSRRRRDLPEVAPAPPRRRRQPLRTHRWPGGCRTASGPRRAVKCAAESSTEDVSTATSVSGGWSAPPRRPARPAASERRRG